MRSRNTTPTRPHTPEEERVKAVAEDTRGRMARLRAELKHHEAFIQTMQSLCDHDWRGQDDEHPHGTPSETFICTVCEKEERR